PKPKMQGNFAHTTLFSPLTPVISFSPADVGSGRGRSGSQRSAPHAHFPAHNALRHPNPRRIGGIPDRRRPAPSPHAPPRNALRARPPRGAGGGPAPGSRPRGGI